MAAWSTLRTRRRPDGGAPGSAALLAAALLASCGPDGLVLVEEAGPAADFESTLTVDEQARLIRQVAMARVFYQNTALRNDASLLQRSLWASSALWLSQQSGVTVSATDVSWANQVLVDLCTQHAVPADTSELDPATTPVYWNLPMLARLLLHPQTSRALTPTAAQALREMLRRYVAGRDNAALIDASSAHAVLRVHSSFNHDLLNKSVFLLVAQHLRTLNGGAGWNVYADGRTAAAHYQRWVDHLRAKLANNALNGLDPELGSPGYVGVTLEAVLNLADLSEDATLKALAGKYVSLYAALSGAGAFSGVRSGPKQRTYATWSFSGAGDHFRLFSHVFANAPSSLPSTWNDRTRVSLFSSTFSLPPAVVKVLAAPTKPALRQQYVPMARSSLVIGPNSGRFANFSYQFSLPSEAQATVSGTKDFALGALSTRELSSSVRYSEDFGQNVWVGLTTAAHVDSRVFFHYGAPLDQPSPGSHLGLQSVSENHALLVQRHPIASTTGRRLLAHLSPDFRDTRVGPSAATGGWLFARSANGTTFVALKAFGASSEAGYALDCEVALSIAALGSGRSCGVGFSDTSAVVALQVGTASAFSSFEDFQSRVKALPFTLAGGRVSFRELGGRTLSLAKDPTTATSPWVDGVAFPSTGPTYSGTFVNSDPSVPTRISVTAPDGERLVLDFSSTPPAPPPPPPSTPLAFTTVRTGTALWPAARLIDRSTSSCYSSTRSDAANSTREWFAAWLSSFQSVSQLRLTPRVSSGAVLGFPKTFDVYVGDETNSRWVSVGRFNASSLTLSGGAYVLSLGGTRYTKGMHVVPTALGTDNYGGYYLQLCEVELLR